MKDPGQATPPITTPPETLVRVARWCAYVSGVVCIFGIAFLVAFYTFGPGYFGTINDITVIVQYALALPIVITLHRILGPPLAATLAGIGGMLAVIVLQILLVADVLSFGEQVGMVIVAFMVILAWFVITGNLGRSNDRVPKGTVLHVLAGLYFGYPVWAFSVGRRLR